MEPALHSTQSRLHHSSLGLAGGGAGRGQWPGRRPERQGAWDRSRVAETQGRGCGNDGRSGCGGSGRRVVTGGQWRGGGGQGERAGGVMGARLLRLHHQEKRSTFLEAPHITKRKKEKGGGVWGLWLWGTELSGDSSLQLFSLSHARFASVKYSL